MRQMGRFEAARAKPNDEGGDRPKVKIDKNFIRAITSAVYRSGDEPQNRKILAEELIGYCQAIIDNPLPEDRKFIADLGHAQGEIGKWFSLYRVAPENEGRFEFSRKQLKILHEARTKILKLGFKLEGLEWKED